MRVYDFVVFLVIVLAVLGGSFITGEVLVYIFPISISVLPEYLKSIVVGSLFWLVFMLLACTILLIDLVRRK